MAWMLVHRAINLDGRKRNPPSKISFGAIPGPVAQEFPQDFVDYAVSKGAAVRVPSPKREVKKALKGVKRAN